MMSERDTFDEYLNRQGNVSNGSIRPDVAGETPERQAEIAARKKALIETLGAGTSAILADHQEVVTQGRADMLFQQMTDEFGPPNGDIADDPDHK